MKRYIVDAFTGEKFPLKESGCEWCRSAKNLILGCNGITVWVDCDQPYLSVELCQNGKHYVDAVYGNKKIAFCPWCGRKLGEPKEG